MLDVEPTIMAGEEAYGLDNYIEGWADDVDIGRLSMGTAWTDDEANDVRTYFNVVSFTPNSDNLAEAAYIELMCMSGAIDGSEAQWTLTVQRTDSNGEVYWKHYSYDAQGGVADILNGEVDYSSYNGTGDTSYVDYYLTAHDGTVGGGEISATDGPELVNRWSPRPDLMTYDETT